MRGSLRSIALANPPPHAISIPINARRVKLRRMVAATHRSKGSSRARPFTPPLPHPQNQLSEVVRDDGNNVVRLRTWLPKDERPRNSNVPQRQFSAPRL